MELWQSLTGLTRLELLCADPAQALERLTQVGIPIFDGVCLADGITARFSVPRRCVPKFLSLARRRGWEWRTLGQLGLYWKLLALLQRPVLLFAILFLLAAALWLPSRILFIQVEGNARIPTRLILEEAQGCGIFFGASRRDIRSQRVKDGLLQALPELQWAGVNTYGSTAVISVRERSQEEAGEETGRVASIVALRDAMVTELTVLRGSAACTPGQAVRSGQVLISGFTDCGLTVRAEAAAGEVYGETVRQLEAALPTDWLQNGQIRSGRKKYALIIGKNRINFYKDSGISGAGCVKMYEENQIFLPGGFPLPVYIVTEIWYDREDVAVTLSGEQAQAMLSEFGERYLRQQMIAGRLRERVLRFSAREGLCRMTGYYACTELIGQVRYEENFNDN